MTTDVFDQLEGALGHVALMSLQQRGLLMTVPDVDAPVSTRASDLAAPEAVRDRVRGALIGAAAGATLGSAGERFDRGPGGFVPLDLLLQVPFGGGLVSRSTAIEQLRLGLEAGLDAGWAQPAALSDALVSRRLRHPSQAIRVTVERRREGAPWFEAGVPSFGNAALIRAVASGLLHVHDPAAVPVVASLDAAVTHAAPAATSASAVLGAAIAGLVARGIPADPDGLLYGLVETVRNPAVRAGLGQSTALAELPAEEALPLIGFAPHAASTLALAWWALLAHPGDPAAAIATVASIPAEATTIPAVVGALSGAAYGAEALPDHWRASVDNTDLAALGKRVLDRIGAPTSDPAQPNAETDAPGETAVETEAGGADIWFLLDRSGSMGSIAGDVVGGFNTFFAEQQAEAGEATVTVVQFDSNDPQETVIDRVPLGSVASLRRDQYRPRGATPLLDALGTLLETAEKAGGHDADQLVVVLTDGYENASSTWDRDKLFGRIERLKERGWTFVFLGANQDSYSEAGRLGMADGNVANFAASPAGVGAAFRGASRATREWRGKERSQRMADRDRFWGDQKESEEEME